MGSLQRHVTFYTSIPDVAEFYQELLSRIGVQNSVRLEVGPADHRKVMGVRIGRMQELKTFAKKVSSVDPDIQAQLDEMKELTSKERHLSKPSSAAAIVEEWRRLTEDVFGHTPSSADIAKLRAAGEPTFALGVYIKYFGKTDEGGPHKFAAARRRLEYLVTLPPEEMEKEVASMPISTEFRKYTDQEVWAEYRRVMRILGHRPTMQEFRNESPMDVNHVVRYLGEVEGQPAFAPARRRQGEDIFP